VSAAPVVIDIVSLPKRWAEREVERAIEALRGGSGGEARQGVTVLRHLGTKGAALALLAHYPGLDEWANFDLLAGLIASPHRELIVERMEARVDAGDPLPGSYVERLSYLRCLLEMPRGTGDYPSRRDRFEALRKEYEARWLAGGAKRGWTEDELGAALRKLNVDLDAESASAGSASGRGPWPGRIENALTNALFDNPRLALSPDDKARIRSLCVTEECQSNLEGTDPPATAIGHRSGPPTTALTFGGACPIVAAMSPVRAESYADRLPPLVPKEERDIDHLSDEMADILYPGRRPRPFRIGLAFDGFDGPAGKRAVELARRSPVYRETSSSDGPRHHADFDSAGARLLRDLFELVGQRPGSEVVVDGKRVPYAYELWLPLMWIFVGAEA
jgi:hypothetical protein